MLHITSLMMLVRGQVDTCPAGGCRPGDTLVVPPVIIGCWQLLERHSNPKAAVQTLMDYAEKGFDTFDTADIYGPSEKILGDFRKQWVASNPAAPPLRFFTKYVTDNPTAAEAERINKVSRDSLGVAAPDLVQFHWWSLTSDGSQRTHLQGGQELSKLKERGLIQHLAGCNMDTTNLKMLVDDGMAIAANQVQYSLLDRRPEVQLLSYCKEQGIKLTVFGVVGGGLLSNSFLGLTKSQAKSKLDSVSRRMYWSSLERWTSDWSLFQKLLQTLKSIGDSKAEPQPIAAVASAWALWQLDSLGAGGGLILGVRDSRHLAEHTALLQRKAQLTQEDVGKIAEVLAQGNPPKGDIWHQERGWA